MRAYLVRSDDGTDVIVASSFTNAIKCYLKKVHSDNAECLEFEFGEDDIESVELVGDVYNDVFLKPK